MNYAMSNVSISQWFLKGKTTLMSGFMTLSRAMEISDINYGNMNYMNHSNTDSILSYNVFEGFDTHGYVVPTQQNDVPVFDYQPGLTFTIYNGYHDENPNYANRASINTSLQPRHNITNSINDVDNGTNGAISQYQSIYNYSIQWAGYFYTGNHTLGYWTFTIQSDDGSYLWVNDQLIINNGGMHGMDSKSGKIQLNSTTFYPIKLLFGQGVGGHNIIFSFTPPNENAPITNGDKYFFSMPQTNELPPLDPIVRTIQNNQVSPLQQISKDYSKVFNNMIQGSSDLSGNISLITNKQGSGIRDVLMGNAQYDFSGSLFNFDKNVTTSDVRVDDTKSLAEQETAVYTLGMIASVTLLIAAIYMAQS
jgi:hypothetical protein